MIHDILKKIINQLEIFEPEELEQLNQGIQQYLIQKKGLDRLARQELKSLANSLSHLKMTK